MCIAQHSACLLFDSWFGAVKSKHTFPHMHLHISYPFPPFSRRVYSFPQLQQPFPQLCQPLLQLCLFHSFGHLFNNFAQLYYTLSRFSTAAITFRTDPSAYSTGLSTLSSAFHIFPHLVQYKCFGLTFTNAYYLTKILQV